MHFSQITTAIVAQADAPATPAQGQQPQGMGLGFFFPLILIYVILYFIFIRPRTQKQRKEQMELQNAISSMRPGDFVVTTSGIHGMVANKSKEIVTVKVADNVKIRFDIAHIAKVTPKGSLSDSPAKEEDVEVEVEEGDEETK